jgi:hypothetical protein
MSSPLVYFCVFAAVAAAAADFLPSPWLYFCVFAAAAAVAGF